MEDQVRMVGLATGKEDDLTSHKSFSSAGNVSSNNSSIVSIATGTASSRFSKTLRRDVRSRP